MGDYLSSIFFMGKKEKIVIRISSDDKKAIHHFAELSGMTPSAYLRKVGLKGILFKTEEVKRLEDPILGAVQFVPKVQEQKVLPPQRHEKK